MTFPRKVEVDPGSGLSDSKHLVFPSVSGSLFESLISPTRAIELD
jgi:hypothetical protein